MHRIADHQDLGPTTRIGIDSHVISQSQVNPLVKAMEADKTKAFVPIKDNLVDLVWAEERPSRPANPIFRLGEEYAGESVATKLSNIRDKLAKTGSPGTVVSALDEVAWLFNLRGSDIPYNPVFFAYAIVTSHDCTLFCQSASVSQEVKDYLQANKVVVLEYSQVWSALDNWREHLTLQKKEAEEKKKAEADAAAAEAAEPREAPAPGATKPAAEAPPADGEKIVKTDKVIIGGSTSWAIANALGGVVRIVPYVSDIRKTSTFAARW